MLNAAYCANVVEVFANICKIFANILVIFCEFVLCYYFVLYLFCLHDVI